MGSKTLHFERSSLSFITPNGPFLYDCHQDWPILESGVAQTLNLPPSLLHLDTIGVNDKRSYNEEDNLWEPPRSFVQDSLMPTEYLENRTPQSDKEADVLEENDRVSPCHPPIQHSSSTHRHSSVESPTGPVEVHKSALQSATKPEPVKRRRGRPRTHHPVVDADNPTDVLVARESHLEKNRIAAEKCRQRQKAHIAKLKMDVSTLSSKNKTRKTEVTALREQLLDLKDEVLRHAGCGSWTIDHYIAQSASGQFGMNASSLYTPSQAGLDQSHDSPVSDHLTDELASQTAGLSRSLSSPTTSDCNVDGDNLVNPWLFDECLL